ncbi:uncharacterized protein [Henckelia pumila]|uniref:uncharacterized protein n=1 Tax=Henckelia pumila TaxID=405737 RepID=UPI003C6E8637
MPLCTPLFWDEFGECQVEGPQMIQQMTYAVEMIHKRIKAAQDRQASYANTHHRPQHFEVGEHVFLRVSPFWKVMRFGLKVKLSLIFIGPFKILKKVEDVAYRLALPPYIFSIHDVFQVSLLREYMADKSHILHPIEVRLNQDLFYVKRPFRILDRKDKVLLNKRIPLVMVLWQRRGTEEATWELESRMRAEDLELFLCFSLFFARKICNL